MPRTATNLTRVAAVASLIGLAGFCVAPTASAASETTLTHTSTTTKYACDPVSAGAEELGELSIDLTFTAQLPEWVDPGDEIDEPVGTWKVDAGAYYDNANAAFGNLLMEADLTVKGTGTFSGSAFEFGTDASTESVNLLSGDRADQVFNLDAHFPQLTVADTAANEVALSIDSLELTITFLVDQGSWKEPIPATQACSPIAVAASTAVQVGEGANGPAGANGTNGADGTAGATGSAGAAGSQGSKGAQGSNGSAGANGAAGSNAAGTTGLTDGSGVTAPDGSTPTTADGVTTSATSPVAFGSDAGASDSEAPIEFNLWYVVALAGIGVLAALMHHRRALLRRDR